MFKKIISIVLALMVLVSMAAVATTVSAADSKFYFEVPSDWKNYTAVYCHIFVWGGSELANWQSKKEKCVEESTGLYSYDPAAKGLTLEAGTTYGIIFSLSTGMETYTTLMSTECYGDTLYCNDTVYENPVDSSKTSRAAFWKNHSATEYGPVMQITSIGNLVGTCLAPGATAQSMFNDFLVNNLTNAQTYSGKSDQDIIDDMATALGLGQDSVEELINASGITVDWKKAESAAPEVDDTSKVPSNSGAVSTGQEMTVVYISVAMMLAAAAVVFFARKKVTE